MTQTTTPPHAVPTGRRPAGRGPREWARAFTGFYPPLAHELADLDPIARFLYSARSVILVISFQAALLAGLLTATDRRFQLVPFVLVVLAYVVLHAIATCRTTTSARGAATTPTIRHGAGTRCTRC